MLSVYVSRGGDAMNFGSLFSGIGGLDLGLERAGMTCKWQVEIDEYCQRVLTKHWPHVPKFGDIRETGKHNLEPVDIICGGFPCQDLSVAGSRRGLREGTRSGLWFEYARIINELRPRFALVENVTGLLVNHAMGRVLGDLAEMGFDVQWGCFSAAEFGLPHIRQRIIIFAYPPSFRWNILRDKAALRIEGQCLSNHQQSGYRWQCQTSGHSPETVGWTVEPNIRGGCHGVPNRVQRLRGLGNAVVPQVAEFIGKQLLQHLM